MIRTRLHPLTAALGAICAAGLLAGVPSEARAGYGPGAGFSVVSCERPAGAPVTGSGATLEVGPGKPFATISAAEAAASEGDTILVHPGVYNEHVVVDVDGLRIRGTDRDGVILDGGHAPGSGLQPRQFGIDVWADRVLVENMTGRHFRHTAFYWVGAVGYWGRNLTAHSNGLYGLYAFDSRCGQFNDSYASGHPDAGFYIGECFMCDAVIHDVVAEENALGYSGTNAGGNLVIRDSLWRNNAMGIVPNTLDSEEQPPQRGVIITDNVVVDNNHRTAPGSGIQAQFFGVGIALAGGKANFVSRNVVSNHEKLGIGVVPLPDQNLWIPSGNVVWDNTVGHDADPRFSAAVDLGQGAVSGPENCWSYNEPGPGQAMVTQPDVLQVVWTCQSLATPPGGDPRVEAELALGVAGLNGRAPSPWQTWPAPTNPVAAVDLADPACDGGGSCAVTDWLPALGL